MSEFVKQNGFQLVLNRVVMRNLSWGKKRKLFPGRRSSEGDAKSDAKVDARSSAKGGSKSDVRSGAKGDAKHLPQWYKKWLKVI